MAVVAASAITLCSPASATGLHKPTPAASTQPIVTSPQPIQPAPVEGPELIWNLSWWGKTRPITAGSERLAGLLRNRTGGRWTLRLHYGSTLAKPHKNLAALTQGKFEAAAFCNFFHPRQNPALMALSLPFIPITDWDRNRRIRDAVYNTSAVRKEMSGHKVALYVSTYLPPFEILGKGEAPATPDDWQGMTVRAGGGIGRAMKVLRAIPSGATAAEAYTGLKQGTMQAASFPFTYAHFDFKIHDVAAWFTSNLAPGTADCPLAFSLAAYNALPGQYKKLLEDVRDEVATAQIQAYRAIDEKNLVIFRSKLMEVTYSDAQRDALLSAAGKPVIEAWITQHQKSFDARALVQKIFSTAGQTYD